MNHREKETYILENPNIPLEKLSSHTSLSIEKVKKILKRNESNNKRFKFDNVKKNIFRIVEIFYQPAQQKKIWAAGILAIIVLILFGKVFFTPDLLISIPTGDLASQFYAWRDYGFSELKNGHLVQWNPYLFCGAPYFAGFQSALLYPPNWLFMVLPLVLALNFSILLHVFLAGFFTYLWLSHHSFNFISALFGAIIFMLGGAFFPHVYPGHLSNLCTMPWIPLVFLMIDGYLKTPSLKWVLGGIAVISMELLAGHVQYFVYTLFFAGIYTLVLLFLEPKRWLIRLMGTFTMVVGALLMTAIQCFPGLAAAGENFRRTDMASESLRHYWSFSPTNLLTLISSGLNGNSSLFCAWGGGAIWWESSIYVGVVAFLLGIYALIENTQKKKWIYMGLASLAILFALGFYTPFYSFLYDWVPTLKSFRGSYKSVIVFQMAFAYLGAMGLQQFITSPFPKIWPVWVAWGLSALLILVGLVVYQVSGLEGIPELLDRFENSPIPNGSNLISSPIQSVRIVNLLESGLFLFATGGLWLWSNSRASWRILMAFLGIFELGLFAEEHVCFFDSGFLSQNTQGLVTKLGPVLGDNRTFWDSENDRALLSRTPDIWGDDPFVPLRYNYFMAYNGSPGIPDTTKGYFPITLEKIKLTRLAFLIGNSNGILKITRTKGPYLPRAILLDHWEEYQNVPEVLGKLNRGDFDPWREVLLEENPNPAPLAGSAPGQVNLQDINTELIEVTAETDRPEILLVSDNYSQNWKADACPDSVQKNYKIIPGDYIFRAIPLLPGRHHFFIKYDPKGFITGKWVSSVSLLLFISVAFASFKRKPNRSNADQGSQKHVSL